MIGCVGIEVNLSGLRTTINQVKVQQTGYAMVVDSSQAAIAHPALTPVDVSGVLADLESSDPNLGTILAQMALGQKGTGNFTKGANNDL